MKTKSAATLLAAALFVLSPLAQAQSSDTAEKPAATPAVSKSKAASHKADKSTKTAKITKHVAHKKPEVSARRQSLKSAALNAAAGISAAEAALTPAELAIAERVQVGKMPCELGASVTLTADSKNPGYFDMQGKNFSYRMFPVTTSTGAVRLEDQKAGAVWLQLANKSMLMNQKLGIRLADECMSPTQVAVAENLKLHPAVSILEPLKSEAAK